METKIENIIAMCDKCIKNELLSIQIQKELIMKFSKEHFNLSKIIVNEARLSIDQSREAIKIFISVKNRYNKPC